MKKRAKDVTLGDLVVTETGILEVSTVGTDMWAGTTLIKGRGTEPLIFGPTEQVETLD